MARDIFSRGLLRPLLRSRKGAIAVSEDERRRRQLPWLSHMVIHVLVALFALAGTAHVCLVAPPVVKATPSTALVPAGQFEQYYVLLRQISMPLVALLIGFILYQVEKTEIIGKLMIYFGAQTSMHLYMKAVLSNAVIDEELGLKGIPAAFLVTALQQVTAFVLFIAFLGVSYLTPWAYKPKVLTTKSEVVAVICFSLTFALNIGFNNFSLSLLSISMNLIIRSCLPLSTALSQGILFGKWVKANEFGVMFIGVTFTALATVAKVKASNSNSGGGSENVLLGVFVGVISIFSGAINFVLAGFLGTSLKLNPLDTTCYMALPATVFLLIPIFLMPHPVWPGFDAMTDWQVFLKIMELSPSTIGLALLSGVFAISYNTLQYALVQTLSATYTAFAGNFNKAATVALALLFGFEHLPSGTWGTVMLIAIIGNIGSFSYYSFMKTGQDKGH